MMVQAEKFSLAQIWVVETFRERVIPRMESLSLSLFHPLSPPLSLSLSLSHPLSALLSVTLPNINKSSYRLVTSEEMLLRCSHALGAELQTGDLSDRRLRQAEAP